MKKWLRRAVVFACLLLSICFAWLWARSTLGGDIWTLRHVTNDGEGSRLIRLAVYSSDGGMQIMYKRRLVHPAEPDLLFMDHKPPNYAFSGLDTLESAWSKAGTFGFKAIDQVYDKLTPVPGRTVHATFPIWCPLLAFFAPPAILNIHRRLIDRKKKIAEQAAKPLEPPAAA